MKGLILKDLMGLKKIAKNYLIFILFYAIIASFSNMHAMFGGIIMIFAFMLPITAMSFDERSKWDSYALTMPISRKDLVLSKYALGLIFAAGSTIINLLYTLLIAKESFSTGTLTCVALFFVGMLFFSIIYPILLKYGVEKGRLTMILVFLAPTIIIMVLAKFFPEISLPSENVLKSLAIILPIVITIMYVASIFISFKICNKKEM